MGPNRTYLSGNEIRSDVRGTEFQKRKERITTVYCCNSTGNHKLPMNYIGKSKNPRCMADFLLLRSRYHAQSSGWMDTERFIPWLQWWYSEVQKLSDGPWLLILDNCGSHIGLPELPGVTYFMLPANTTALYQPLDQGIIANTKTSYRAALLRKTIEILEQRGVADNGYRSTSGNGRYGLREGQLPHVADGMLLMDAAWENVSKKTIVNCWLKSKCLPTEHVSYLKGLITPNGSGLQEHDGQVADNELSDLPS